MSTHQSYAARRLLVEFEARRPKPPAPAESVNESTFARILKASIGHAHDRRCDVEKFLIYSGRLTERQLYRGLAARLGVPFIRHPVRLNPTILPHDALQTGLAPVDPSLTRLPTDTPIFVYAPQGKRLEWLIAENLPLLGWPHAHIGIMTPKTFRASVRATFGTEISNNATTRLIRKCRSASAFSLRSVRWFGLILFLLGILLISLFYTPTLWHGLLLGISVFPIVPGLILKLAALHHHLDGDMSSAPIEDSDLPTYSVLVPIYRESRIIPQLIEALMALDYPSEKIEIKLLIEADDNETLATLNHHILPNFFDIVICPRGEPRTKPRALTIGLAHSASELVVVYDAEDCPEPDQLKKAASIFVSAEQNLACVQARLSIDNLDDSWFTRQFAIEYGALFDVLLPGLSALNHPIPLGGTSNHFRQSALDAVSAWDPWNVTEDADLGLRLYRAGYRVRTFHSTTHEEAPTSFQAWSHQRTRWLKGWMQTACVHLRSHGRDRDPLLVRQWIALILGASLSPICILLHPALLMSLDVIIHCAAQDYQPTAVSYAIQFGVAVMFVFSFCLDIIIAQRGAKARSIKFRIRDMLGSVPYSLLKTRAGWLALFELLYAPFHWRKTAHGLARSSRRYNRDTAKTAF